MSFVEGPHVKVEIKVILLFAKLTYLMQHIFLLKSNCMLKLRNVFIYFFMFPLN